MGLTAFMVFLFQSLFFFAIECSYKQVKRYSMQKNVLETLMGAVVLAVAGGFLFFAYKGSEVRVEEGYAVTANFSNIAGITLGSDVRIGGIKVGTVTNLALDPETYDAVARINIHNGTDIPKDSTASIVSSGLLGDKYIQISPGGDDAMLKSGEKINYTQSSVNLEELIGKFMFSGGGVDKDTKETATP
jgi:phospholipid/cholesterol/gamma-HCH transport system substrate-binding protein